MILDYVWGFMLLCGIVIGAMNGKLRDISNTLLDSANKSVSMAIGLMGVMCLWLGIMNIAKKAGIIEAISRRLKPAMRFLFPDIPDGHPAQGAILMNIIANMLGLGNAATPLGLKAMEEMQKINKNKKRATNSMCMFLVLNTACIQLIPATVIAIRLQSGSKNPTEIIVTTFLSAIVAVTTGICCTKVAEKGSKK
ncbi:MAG: hypothetical protein K8E24_012155 [Methanobacterium paludis]|nr:hypothetical protein [Methanobacterium paludis]